MSFCGCRSVAVVAVVVIAVVVIAVVAATQLATRASRFVAWPTSGFCHKSDKVFH